MALRSAYSSRATQFSRLRTFAQAATEIVYRRAVRPSPGERGVQIAQVDLNNRRAYTRVGIRPESWTRGEISCDAVGTTCSRRGKIGPKRCTARAGSAAPATRLPPESATTSPGVVRTSVALIRSRAKFRNQR